MPSTIQQHTSNLRGLLKQYSRSTDFTDQFLFEILSGARADVLKSRLDRYNKVSLENFMTICVELEKTKPHSCDCVPDELDCLVLRTKYKIPTVLSGRNTSKISIRLLNGKQISIMDENRWMLIKNDPIKSKDLVASWINGYFYFWNLPLSLKVIEITGLFTNPLDLIDIPNCSGEYPTGTCFQIDTTEFPLQEEFKHFVYRKCFELLQIPLQSQVDLTNDSNEFIKI